jgi:hypothetical protein
LWLPFDCNFSLDFVVGGLRHSAPPPRSTLSIYRRQLLACVGIIARVYTLHSTVGSNAKNSKVMTIKRRKRREKKQLKQSSGSSEKLYVVGAVCVAIVAVVLLFAAPALKSRWIQERISNEEAAVHERCFEWAKRVGIEHADLEVRYFSYGFKHASGERQEVQVRGLTSQRELNAGDVIATLPKRAVLVRDNLTPYVYRFLNVVLGTPCAYEHNLYYLTWALLLEPLFERWRPYIEAMELAYPDLPLFWPKERVLDDYTAQVWREVQGRRKQYAAYFQIEAQRFADFDMMPLDELEATQWRRMLVAARNVTQRDFERMLSLIISRGFKWTIGRGNDKASGVRCGGIILLPLIDFINVGEDGKVIKHVEVHLPTREQFLNTNDDSDVYVVVTAGRHYDAGQELVFDYGDKSNTHYIVLYGIDKTRISGIPSLRK